MAKTRLVLVGPMSGMPQFNYPAFRTIQAVLQRAGFTVWSPHETGEKIGPDQPYPVYLRASLLQILRADGLVVLPGSAGSKGAYAEMQVGLALGLPCHPVHWWVDPEGLAERLVTA